jgi:hypothetical protein
MPLIAPVLDDRSFEDLFAELRNRIPVYTPEWTDYQDSDPGITLLQLFAYLGEGLQFRFNQIPEATQLAFLKLLGIPMLPPRPAQALVRFSSKAANGVSLYAGDQVKAGKTLYTLSQDATAWPLDCVAAARQALLSEEDLADNAKVEAWITGLDKEVGDAVQASVDALDLGDGDHVAPYQTLTLPSDGTGPAVDFSATVDGVVWIGVLANPDAGIPVADILDPTQGLRWPAGRPISLSLGFSPAAWYPTIDQAPACAAGNGPSLLWQASLAALKADGSPGFVNLRVGGDTTAGFTQQGVVRIDLPADPAPLGVPVPPDALAGTGAFPPALDDTQADRLWFWLRVWRADGSRIGPVQLVSLNTVDCEQVVAAAPELLGAGTGQPGQVFTLANAPVLLDARWPVQLQVEESGTWTDWSRVDDFDASSQDDRHFAVDAEAATVSFGDGVNGRAPQLGQRIRVNAYRFGGGAAGNVPAGAIAKIGDTLPAPVPPLPLMRPTQVDLPCANPLPAQGGADGESLADALARLPTELRRNRRAVAQSDFAELALQTPAAQLARAECMPLFHAPSRSLKPGCVSVVAWPSQDPQHPNAPLPDAWTLAQVCSWLDQWRLVTTELYVIPPTYRRIAIAVSVKVQDGYGLDAVRDWLDLLLRQYLAPVPPYGPAGAGWPLGRRVIARELEGVAMQVEGVDYIQDLRLDFATANAGGSETWAPIDVLEIADWEVPAVAGIVAVDDATPLPAPGADLEPPPSAPAVPVPVPTDEC